MKVAVVLSVDAEEGEDKVLSDTGFSFLAYGASGTGVGLFDRVTKVATAGNAGRGPNVPGAIGRELVEVDSEDLPSCSRSRSPMTL